MMSPRFHVSSIITVLIMGTLASADEPGQADAQAHRFVEDHVARVKPLERAAALAWWNANITGKDEDFQAKEEAQNRLDAALADSARFADLKRLKGMPIEEKILAREI